MNRTVLLFLLKMDGSDTDDLLVYVRGMPFRRVLEMDPVRVDFIYDSIY